MAEDTHATCLANELLSQAEVLRARFSAEGNYVRAGHMAVLMGAVMRLKASIEAAEKLPPTDRACAVILEIQRLGYPEAEDFDANERRVLPLLAKYNELKRHAAAI
jgi:hypothetical protein